MKKKVPRVGLEPTKVLSSLGSIEFAPIIWIFKKIRLNLGSVLKLLRLYEWAGTIRQTMALKWLKWFQDCLTNENREVFVYEVSLLTATYLETQFSSCKVWKLQKWEN